MSALAIKVPEEDSAEFSALPVKTQDQVRRWIRILRPVFNPPQGCRCKIGEAMRRVGKHMGVSTGSAYRLYGLYRNGGFKGGVNSKGHGKKTFFEPGDWRVFINRAAAPLESKGLAPEIIEEFRREAEQNQRKNRPAHRRFIRRWRAGELDHLPWPEIDATGIPAGCSYRNLNRYLKAFDLLAMRQGLGAALAGHGRQFLSTRAGLYVGSHYLLDDVTRDLRAVWIAGNQTIRIQELGALDLFAADRFASHRRPQFTREEDGKRDSIKERETRCFLAGILRNTGYSMLGTELVTELGTAAVRKPLQNWLLENTRSLVTVREPGAQGEEQVIAGYWGRGGGNPRHKAALESHHNLLHNESAHLPAQTGHDRNYPEWLHGVEAVTGQVLRWMAQLPPDQAALLECEELEYWKALRILADLDRVIATRTDHNLEGWELCGHTTIEYCVDLLDDRWLPQTEVLRLPDARRQQIVRAADMAPHLRRPRKLSPREVFAAGVQELRTLPDHVIALLYCDRELGDDLRQPKRLTSARVFDISDSFAEPGRMYFEPYAVEPDGARRPLDEKTTYGVVLNPYDRDQLWIYAPNGGYIGTSPRQGRVSPHDEKGVRQQLGEISRDRAALLAPVRQRHAARAQEIEAMQSRNRLIAEGKPATPEAVSAARREKRTGDQAARAGAAMRQTDPAARLYDRAAGVEVEKW